MPEQKPVRRILAIYLPEILCELARGAKKMSLRGEEPKPRPLGVLLAQRADEVSPRDRLAAVCGRAFCAGVRPGQTPAEANANLAGLQIQVVEYCQVGERLLAIAEMAKNYGTLTSWNATQHIDTVWLDVTGVGHLYGGEENLCQELAEQVRLVGHRVRLAIASGPHIAQAVARFGHAEVQILAGTHSAGGRAMADLPLAALPLDQERIQFLGRLGIFQIGQLADLPPAAASSRLGPEALRILQLIEGIDASPLVQGEFPRSLQEESLWDEPVEGLSPLTFALHGIVSRLSARLRGRGEACSSIECELLHDPAIARHLHVLETTVLQFDLASPLHQEADLERVIRTRFESCELLAPTVGLRVRVGQLSAQAQHQLGLSRRSERSFQSGGPWAEEFPILVAELQSDVGSAQVGTLKLASSHIPEECSAFQPLSSPKSGLKKAGHFPQARRSAKRKQGTPTRTITEHKLGLDAAQKENAAHKETASKKAADCLPALRPEGASPGIERLTRLLPYPRKLNVPLRVGESFALGGELYVIDRLRFVKRLADAKWWSESSLSRDYHWAWLRCPNGGTEALLFVDKKSGEGFVQALRD